VSVIVARLRSAGCVFAEDEARLLVAAARTVPELTEMVSRRAGGLPLEHVLGWAEFCGQRVAVDPGVFVPRRRTEFLVQQAALLARSPRVIVDLCCGSGAVGVALLAVLGRGIELHATDLDPVAVRCARGNVGDAGGQVHEGDLYEPLPVSLRGRVDLLVANAPYVPTEAIELMPPEARIYESRMALDGGADGLEVQRRLIASAPQWLAPAGHLLIETSPRQVARTVQIIVDNGLISRVASSEDLGATVVIATLS